MRALKLLNTLFSPTVLPDEKKRILSEKYNIAMTVELESEVQRMCNLGTAIESKARDEGRAEGRAEGRNEGVDLMAKLVDMLMEADRYADVKKVTMLKKVPVPGKNKYLKENWYKKLRGKDNSLTDSIQDRI